MAAWKSSSTTMKTEPLPAPCPFCGSREAALRARVAELEQIVIASLKAAPVGYIPTHTAERLPEIIADMTTACREHSEEREQAEARVAELEAALRDAVGMLEELDGLDWGEEGMPFDVDFNHFAKVLSPVPFGGAVGRGAGQPSVAVGTWSPPVLRPVDRRR